MKRRFNVYLYISIIFYLVVFGLFALKLSNLYNNHLKEINNTNRELRLRISSIYLASPQFESEFFRERMHQLLESHDNLVSIKIFSPEGSIQYSLVKKFKNTFGGYTDLVKDKFTHSFLVVYRSPISLGERNNFILQTSFRVISDKELYSLLKNLFFIIVVFLIVSIIYGLYLLTAKTKRGKVQSQGNLFSPLSGLVWEEYLDVTLEKLLQEIRDTGKDLSLAFISIDNMEEVKDRDNLYLQIARLLLNNFPSRTHIFEWKSGFALILPQIGVDESIKRMESFRQKVLEKLFPSYRATVSIGLSSRNGRNITHSTLTREASLALRKAIREGKNQVIAFKANPMKYRELFQKQS